MIYQWNSPTSCSIANLDRIRPAVPDRERIEENEKFALMLQIKSDSNRSGLDGWFCVHCQNGRTTWAPTTQSKNCKKCRGNVPKVPILVSAYSASTCDKKIFQDNARFGGSLSPSRFTGADQVESITWQCLVTLIPHTKFDSNQPGCLA